MWAEMFRKDTVRHQHQRQRRPGGMPLVTLLFGYLIVLNSTIEELWVRVRRMKMSERTMMSIRKCAPERLSDCMRGPANRAVKPAAIKAGGSSCRRNCARLIRSEQGGPLIEFAF